jgi:hypothetical protein
VDTQQEVLQKLVWLLQKCIKLTKASKDGLAVMVVLNDTEEKKEEKVAPDANKAGANNEMKEGATMRSMALLTRSRAQLTSTKRKTPETR